MPKQTIANDPQVLDLVLYAGDGIRFRVVVTDSLGAPINLTGTMKAQIRVDRTTTAPKAAFTVDLTDAADGIALLSLTGTQTAGLVTLPDKFTGVWDLEWSASGSQPVTLCQGKVECMPDVSR